MADNENIVGAIEPEWKKKVINKLIYFHFYI